MSAEVTRNYVNTPTIRHNLDLVKNARSKRRSGIHSVHHLTCTLKESPIHHQNYIELKRKGAILMGDEGEGRKMMGGGVLTNL